MDDMIDFLRDKTIFARHSRAETRDFLERLVIEGWVLMQIPAQLPNATKVSVLPDEDEPLVEV